jgi:hypothetical protein
VKAPLHHELGLTLAHETHRLRGSGVAFTDVHHLGIAELDTLGLGKLGDLRRRSNQDWPDQAFAGGVDRAR